jgi:hypothetical protein
VDNLSQDIEAILFGGPQPYMQKSPLTQGATSALTQLFERKLVEEQDRLTANALTVAKYWIEEDGRPKHLLLDLEEIRDISTLDHLTS